MSDTTNIFEQIPDLDTLGGRISRARDARGITTDDLARQLGIRAATVQAWETDRSEPGTHRLSNLSGMLGVSLSWLLHGVGAGPSLGDDGETPDAVRVQLTRLRNLHRETGQLLDRIQGDLDRVASAAPG